MATPSMRDPNPSPTTRAGIESRGEGLRRCGLRFAPRTVSRAMAEAVLSACLDRDAALRAARNLARMALIWLPYQVHH